MVDLNENIAAATYRAWSIWMRGGCAQRGLGEADWTTHRGPSEEFRAVLLDEKNPKQLVKILLIDHGLL